MQSMNRQIKMTVTQFVEESVSSLKTKKINNPDVVSADRLTNQNVAPGRLLHLPNIMQGTGGILTPQVLNL